MFPYFKQTYIGARSLAQGLSQSRLPVFTEEEKQKLAKSSDFFGLNSYTTNLIYNSFTSNVSISYFGADTESRDDYDITWPQAESFWLQEVCFVYSFLQTVPLYINSKSDKMRIKNDQLRLIQVPWGIRRLLNFISDNYGNKSILITENGLSEAGSSADLNDWWRKEFYTRYINEVLKGISFSTVQ